MHDSPAVSRLQRFGDLSPELERFGDRQRPGRQLLGEGIAFDELEDQEAPLRGFLDAVDRGDARMIHGREKLRFPLEA